MTTVVWVDASAGVAGDMLAGAFVDSGVPLEDLQAAVDAVMPGTVRLTSQSVQRHGLHAIKFDVMVLEVDPPHRRLSDIRHMVAGSTLSPTVRDAVIRVFETLGAAEAAAHGVDVEQVHFHEVGAADSIADIVAVCAALAWLGVDDLHFGELALGSGQVRTDHGELAVPTPAALQLTHGLRVRAGGMGELATPTGLALLRALGTQGNLPSLRVTASGSGAGSKDFPDHANVVRVVVGEAEADEGAVLIETNIDDMDPRLWPGVIAALMAAGAQDAWLTPILMKKGRPAHTLSVLGHADDVSSLSELVLRQTTTIGVRTTPVSKIALARAFDSVEIEGHTIAVKVAGRRGRIYNVAIEFEDVARAAEALQRSQRDVMQAATNAVVRRGLVTGAEFAEE